MLPQSLHHFGLPHPKTIVVENSMCIKVDPADLFDLGSLALRASVILFVAMFFCLCLVLIAEAAFLNED